MPVELDSTVVQRNAERVNTHRAGKPIVIIGMMGAGKSTVGKRVAHFLNLDFVDSDDEIELAAGMPIPDIFETHGEEEFRAGETRVIARLLRTRRDAIISTGGGAFMDATTRKNIAQHGICVWLKADVELLFERVSRRNTRPLLHTPDPFGTLKALVDQRYPTYAEADLTVMSHEATHEQIASEIIEALAEHLDPNKKSD
ncbi:shikimate kinase [Maritalea porphyrae]|uniref:Shikimate kinase n=1 Tax=Maritalea porphyrae TaxID=880732 RepID=A0ABQ5UNR9_9HYPH|nr:shikimate kinase [Maritalea porphyrae]GLQ16509.1 shikimate kinase [Maritalea porphyrae]